MEIANLKNLKHMDKLHIKHYLQLPTLLMHEDIYLSCMPQKQVLTHCPFSHHPKTSCSAQCVTDADYKFMVNVIPKKKGFGRTPSSDNE